LEIRDTGRWKCPRCRAIISFIRIRGGKAGQEKTLIDAVPGGAQERSVSYLLCRSAGAREVVAGLAQVDSVGNIGKSSGMGSADGGSTCPGQCPCPATAGGGDSTVVSAGAGGGVVDAGMGPDVLKAQLSVRGGEVNKVDVSKVGSMVILDVDVSLLRDDEITLWQSEGDLLRSRLCRLSLSLSFSLSFSLSLALFCELPLFLARALSLSLALALSLSCALALSHSRTLSRCLSRALSLALSLARSPHTCSRAPDLVYLSQD
jgi:hypothetical protein